MDKAVGHAILESLSGTDLLTEFRAVSIADHRRGIRLERIYWQALKALAMHEKTTISNIVASVEAEFPNATNITSILRVIALSWTQEQLQQTRQVIGGNSTSSLILASPAPAIGLAQDKRVVAYNPQFLTFLQNRLGLGTSTVMPRNLRLILDVQITDLIQTLTENGNHPVKTGIVLGSEDRRVRGTLNVLLAPTLDETTLLGFIVSG